MPIHELACPFRPRLRVLFLLNVSDHESRLGQHAGSRRAAGGVQAASRICLHLWLSVERGHLTFVYSWPWDISRVT